MQKMRTIHADDDSVGDRPMQKLLLQQNIPIGRRRTQRLMQQAGLRGYVQRKYVVTTQSEGRIATPDRVQRQFHRTSLNQLWVADATHLPSRSLSGHDLGCLFA